MEKLAILGGSPVREKPISYGKQCIEPDDIKAVAEALCNDIITNDSKVEELEKKICEITGAKYAVVVANGTAALHLAALAADLGPGDEVIVSSITFAASSNCVLYCGATPVFADINSETYNVDPESIRKLITPHTKAIVAVDFTGQSVEHDAIYQICQENNLLLIEDAAHAFGTSYKGQMIGSIADMTCFSYHPVKTVTAGEGGAITTNNEKYYRRLKLLRTHGITYEQPKDSDAPKDVWYNDQVELGFNYRMTEFQAALLLSQINKLPKFSARRKEIVEKYNKAFSEMPEIFVQREIPESDTTRHLYVIRLNRERLTCGRREFFDALCAENIRPQVHYLPVYWHSFYKNLGYREGLCPNAENYYQWSMSIPLYYSLTDQDVEDTIRAVKKVVEYYRK